MYYNNMYLLGNPNSKIFMKKPVVVKELAPISNLSSDSTFINVSQLGSGIKSIQNKLDHINLHSNSKKKYDKFISLNL